MDSIGIHAIALAFRSNAIGKLADFQRPAFPVSANVRKLATA
jgi:hypothetical protein